jgi:prepilin-type N-terminal cleavage/methylation domain-containing protein
MSPTIRALKRRLATKRGFSLVEIMVALTITLIVVMALAAGTAAVARMSGNAAGLVRQTASMEEVATSLSVIPWANLPAGTTCDTVTGGGAQRCVTTTNVNTKTKRFTIIVTPEDPRVPPDTLVVERGRGTVTNPFNSP